MSRESRSFRLSHFVQKLVQCSWYSPFAYSSNIVLEHPLVARQVFMGKKKKSRNARRPQNVKVLRPAQDEARDEGPRLIPLERPKSDESAIGKMGEYYLSLADQVLRPKRSE